MEPAESPLPEGEWCFPGSWKRQETERRCGSGGAKRLPLPHRPSASLRDTIPAGQDRVTIGVLRPQESVVEPRVMVWIFAICFCSHLFLFFWSLVFWVMQEKPT